MKEESNPSSKPEKAAKIPPTVNVVFHKTADGYNELIIDVTGAYTQRTQLKAHDFQFVSDRSDGMETATQLDRNGNRKRSAVWRRIIAAVPSEASPAQAITHIETAIDVFGELLNNPLKGSRVRGANSAALKIAEYLKDTEGVSDLTAKLAAMDTPWQPGPTNFKPVIRRPAFAL